MDHALSVKRALAALVVGAAGVALVGVVSASCGGESPPGPVSDVAVGDATDARSPVRDARTPLDGDAEDVWLADSEVPYPGEWRTLPGLPANCPVRVAVNPEASIEPFAWTACTSGRPGCKVFVPKWTGPDSFAFVQGHLGGAFEDSGGVVLAYSRSTRGRPEQLSVVQELEGKARAAFFGLSTEALTCSVLKISATSFGTAGLVFYETQSLTRVFSVAASSNATNLRTLELTQALAPRIITQGMLRGDDILTLEHNAGGVANYVSALRLSDGQLIPGFPGSVSYTHLTLPTKRIV